MLVWFYYVACVDVVRRSARIRVFPLGKECHAGGQHPIISDRLRSSPIGCYARKSKLIKKQPIRDSTRISIKLRHQLCSRAGEEF